jgi:heat shock protein HtpX
MWLQMRLYLLVGLLLAIVYGVIVGIASAAGSQNFIAFAIVAVGFVFLQYLISPAIVGWTMKVKYVTEKEYPDLHRMVAELANAAGIRKPKVGVSRIAIPNAFAFGRNTRDARICVTEPLLKTLNREELRAVLGHEISHIKHRDMMIMTLLSVVPLIIYLMAINFLFAGRRESSPLPLIGIGLLVLYFIVNLMVLYGSRVREYYADLESVKLGNQPNYLASALYRLVLGSARAPKEAVKAVEGAKAFFLNDPSRALSEVRELKQIDSDLSGTIDQGELMALRSKKVSLSTGEKIMEIMSTHPNMLKRIKHLSSLS